MSVDEGAEVRIGSGAIALVFEGPPTAEHIGARVEGPYVTAGDSIVLDESLVTFFTDLDRSWRGWAGDKTWTSAGANMEISARHDGVGHVLIATTFRSPGLRDGDAPRDEDEWAASAVVTIEAGALGPIAASLRAVRAMELFPEGRSSAH